MPPAARAPGRPRNRAGGSRRRDASCSGSGERAAPRRCSPPRRARVSWFRRTLFGQTAAPPPRRWSCGARRCLIGSWPCAGRSKRLLTPCQADRRDCTKGLTRLAGHRTQSTRNGLHPRGHGPILTTRARVWIRFQQETEHLPHRSFFSIRQWHRLFGRRRLERYPQPHPRRRGEALERARQGLRPTAFEPRDCRLRRVHPLGQLLLREARVGPRYDHRLSKPEFLLERVVGLDVLRVLAPCGEGFLDGDHLPAHVTSCARRRASSISRRGVFWVFLVNTRRITTRRPVAVTYRARAIPSLPRNRISQIRSSICLM